MPNIYCLFNFYYFFQNYMHYDSIFAESADMHSFDVTWEISKCCFSWNRQNAYMQTQMFCPLACFWGIVFALTAYCENMCVRPFNKCRTFTRKLPDISFCKPMLFSLKNICLALFDDDEEGKPSNKDLI